MRQSRVKHCRGFFTVEAVGAILLLVVLALVLSVAVGRQRKGSDRLAASRAAVNLAESALTALQAGDGLPHQDGATVKVEPVAASAPKGLSWATVTVSINGRSASLTGLVKSDALEKARGGKS